jgi:hypothetical protein
VPAVSAVIATPASTSARMKLSLLSRWDARSGRPAQPLCFD